MCLNETYSKVFTCKHLTDTFPLQEFLKQEDALSLLLLKLKTLSEGANGSSRDTEHNICATSYITPDNSRSMAYLILKVTCNERIKTDLSKIMFILFQK
jgi:hypothetical protein